MTLSSITSAILREWVAAHMAANDGALPYAHAGAIPGADRTWLSLNDAMRAGKLSFTTCASLADWLADQYPQLKRTRSARLTADRINELVAAYQVSHDGEFPFRESGKVAGHNFTWANLDNTLIQAGSSLAKWMQKRYPEYEEVPEARLRRWVEEYADRNGRALPAAKSGPIEGAGWTWAQVESAMVRGAWRWVVGESLAKWLDRTYPDERILTPTNLRRWVEDHVATYGSFPTKDSDSTVAEKSGWTWRRLNKAMEHGSMGWPERSGLNPWLDREYPALRLLTAANLHAWVAGHVAVHGHYPTRQTPGFTAPGGQWTWLAVDNALRRETAGWVGKTTLADWIDGNMQATWHEDQADLDENQITEQLAPA